jgi:hypothetical protein
MELAQHSVVHGYLQVGSVFDYGIFHALDSDKSRRAPKEQTAKIHQNHYEVHSLFAEAGASRDVTAEPSGSNHGLLHKYRLRYVLSDLRFDRRHLCFAAILLELSGCLCRLYSRPAGTTFRFLYQG